MSKRRKSEGGVEAIEGFAPAAESRGDRVADQIYASVFAAAWLKRADLDDARRQAVARSEAARAARLGREGYELDIALAPAAPLAAPPATTPGEGPS